MKKIIWIAGGVIVLALAYLLVYSTWFRENERDMLRVAYYMKLSNLDQYSSTSRGVLNIGYLIWDPLVTRDPDTGSIMPHLATKWRVINPTTWEFKLQAGVKFHNGNPLNAECIRYTLVDRILTAEKSPRKGNFNWIKDIKVIDDLTFRIVSHEPYPLVLERLNTLFPYDPIESKAKDDSYIAEHPVGTGPYRVVSFERDAQVLMEANPTYWKKGYPKIKKIIIHFVPNASDRLEGLISGRLDVAMNLGHNQWHAVQNAEGVEPMDMPVLRIVFWQFDSMGRAKKSPLMDKRVRQAIWHAIDRNKIIEDVLGGRADFLNSPVNPYQFGYTPSIEGFVYDPEKAKSLLKAAGYPDGFTISLWQYYEEQHLFNQAALDYLAKVGIKVKVHDYRDNVGQLLKLRNSGKVDGIGNYSWGSYNIFDADAILPAWFLLEEKKNYTGDEQLDKWLKEARFAVGYGQREKLYAKASRRIIDEAYWMPCFIMHRIWGRKANLHLVVGRDEVPRFAEAYWMNLSQSLGR